MNTDRVEITEADRRAHRKRQDLILASCVALSAMPVLLMVTNVGYLAGLAPVRVSCVALGIVLLVKTIHALISGRMGSVFLGLLVGGACGFGLGYEFPAIPFAALDEARLCPGQDLSLLGAAVLGIVTGTLGAWLGVFHIWASTTTPRPHY